MWEAVRTYETCILAQFWREAATSATTFKCECPIDETEWKTQIGL